MAKGDFPDELEQMLIPAILRLGDDAFGMTVRGEPRSDGAS